MDADMRAKLKRIRTNARSTADWVRHDMTMLALEARPDILGVVVERAEPAVLRLLRQWAVQWCLDNPLGLHGEVK